MSLVTTASPWVNDDSNNRRRTPTMKKPMKMTANTTDKMDDSNINEGYQNLKPSNFDDLDDANNDRATRVNALLDKITSTDNNDDNTKMGNFKPIEYPALNIKKDIDDNTEARVYKPPMPSYLSAGNMLKNGGLVYGADDTKSAVFSNYNKSYEPPTTITNKPYYASMGIGGTNNSGSSYNDNKLMEKINYMIHLLEQQQMDKTNNITEEFILYTFLGIFVIYICDSFARAGKYTR